jgi:hypothetical protein
VSPTQYSLNKILKTDRLSFSLGKQPEEEKIRIAKFGRFHQNLKERAERKTLSNSRLLKGPAINQSIHKTRFKYVS